MTLGLAAALAAVIVGGAALWASWPEAPSAAVLDALAEGQECNDGGACVGPLYESLDEVLTNTRFRAPHFTEGPFSDVVAVGRFTDVRSGRGFLPSEGGVGSGIPTSFDDPEAAFRIARATFVVDEVIDGEVADDAVTVDFQVDPAGEGVWPGSPAFDDVERGLPELGRLALVLDRSAATSAQDRSTYGMVGGLLLRIEADGGLALPLHPDDVEVRLLARTPTLDDLREAAQAPPRVIELNSIGDRVE